MNMKYTLYVAPTCGSAVIEILLEKFAVSFEVIEIDTWPDRRAAEAHLLKLNPIDGQIPILVLPSGHIMTESAAIIFYLCEKYGGLAPTDDQRRADFYRWTVFIAANIYSLIAQLNHPEYFVTSELEADFRTRVIEQLKRMWLHVESAVGDGPFMLGSTMSALDIYIAMVSRWRPGRAWRKENCPKIEKLANVTEQDPVVASVFAKRFP